MSISDTFNSSLSNFNPIKSISNEFIFPSDSDFNSLIFSFFKTFSSHITPGSLKIKFDPKIFDAKDDCNIATIFEEKGKLYIKSGDYKNEFDEFFTKINRYREQKRKIRQCLKNGSLVYEVPLYKSINLNDLNEKIYEETIFSREFKYDYIGNIFYPLNDQRLNKDENFIFNLNQKSKYFNKGALVVLDNAKYNDNIIEDNYINDTNKINNNENEEEIINKNDEKSFSTNNIFNNIRINNENNSSIDVNDISKDNIAFFKNNEIMVEITKHDNFIEENISLYLLNLSNNQNHISSYDIATTNINTIEDILKSTENPHILDAINHFNNIFTPELYNKFSLYKNIKINNDSQVLKDINSVFNMDNDDKNKNENNIENKNNKLILDDEDEENLNNLIIDIKKYFDEEMVKEINKDIEITQNFTHFYIEGNKFSKDNMKKIISFLNKEKFYMFAWSFNKELTKKYGIINNIIKVANLSNKVWFYINSKKSGENI